MNRGRSSSPRRTAPNRARSFDASTMNRNRSRSGSIGPGGGDRDRGRSVERGRSRSPTRGVSRNPSMEPSSRPRSQSRTRGASQDPSSRPAMRGKKPLRKGVRRVGKGVKKVGKYGGKGVRKVGKVGGKGVRKFQKTKIGKRIAPEEKCSPGKFCSYLCALLLLLVSSVGLLIASGTATLDDIADTVKGIVPGFDVNNQEDPFSGEDVPIWDNGGSGGLTMEILNALDDEWQTEFEIAFYDWEFGTPDALSLSRTKVPYELNCVPVEGKVKVCNKDHGEQPWRGIASATLGGDGYMVECIAEMNDYFLKYAESDLRQYTMCHELGHSFGLAHEDEDFYNEDLNNCMDYTLNYSNSKHPKESNFLKLEEYYGLVGEDGQRRRQQRKRGLLGVVGVGQHHHHHQQQKQQQQQQGSNKNSLRQRQQQQQQQHQHERRNNIISQKKKVPQEVKNRRMEVMNNLEKIQYKDIHQQEGWRMLRKTKFVESYELDLGQDYKLKVNMLLA